MNDKKCIKMLWLDDQIHDLSNQVTLLTKNDFNVDISAESSSAIEMVKQKKYDIILADIRMPPPYGIEFLKQAYKESPESQYAVYSSYLYFKTYRDDIKKLKFPIQPIEKKGFELDSDLFKRSFIDTLKKMYEKGVQITISDQDNKAMIMNVDDPFNISYNDFISLSWPERDKIVDVAHIKAKKTLQKAFSEGYIWVLLCGDSNSWFAAAKEYDCIYDDEKITHISVTQGKPAYQFFAPKDVDDIAKWTECGKSCELDYYPTVTLKIDGREFTLHFDTGSPITFFSYEELKSFNAISEPLSFGISYRLGKKYHCIELNKDVIIKSQDGGQTQEIMLRGECVRDWVDSPFKRLCDDECTIYDIVNSKIKICPERYALIGRNILKDNECLRIVLDGENKITRLE